jgi:glucokinase
MTDSTNRSGAILGVDIGGTKVAVGLVDLEGKILAQSRKPMVADSTPEAGLQAVTDAIDSLLTGETQSIGICAPGPLDPKTGVVLNPPNVPCWRNFPLAEKIAAKYRVPVKVDNDGNAAALAETRWGAARGYRFVFYGTLGTGIGSGIVLDGRIYHGNTGSAAEGGHMSIDYRGPVCNCGKRGCIEILAAGPAIALRAKTKLRADPSHQSAILDLAKGDVQAVTS